MKNPTNLGSVCGRSLYCEQTSRRQTLGWITYAIFSILQGCHAQTPPHNTPIEPDRTPLVGNSIHDLIAFPGVKWCIFAYPREIALNAKLLDAIQSIIVPEQFENIAHDFGFDIRSAFELALVEYDPTLALGRLYAVAHNAKSTIIEKHFSERIVSEPTRISERPDLVRVSGRIGTEIHAMTFIENKFAFLQQGGLLESGSHRIAALYAENKLKRLPTIFSKDPFQLLVDRFGYTSKKRTALAIALARGPFKDEWSKGLHGLLGASTAIGAVVRPSVRDGLLLSISLTGDFSKTGEQASQELIEAWKELSQSSFGELLRLSEAIDQPIRSFTTDAITMHIELNPTIVASGLRRATIANVEEIMK